MIKRMLILLVLAVALSAGLEEFVNFRASMIRTAIGSMANPPQTVSTALAEEQDWQSTLTAIGSF